MDDLKMVRIFLRVAELASFAETARQLGTTPATVSRTVAGLEKSLGTQLLLRTTRQVSLTTAGATFAARMAPLIEEMDRVAADLRDGEGIPSGRIRMTAPMSFGLRVLPDLLTDFREAHPRVEIHAVLSDEFLDIVGAGYDLAVRVTTPPEDKSTIWRKLCPIDRVLVTTADGPASRVTHPRELPPAHLIAHSAAAWIEEWTLTGPNGERRIVKAGSRLSANSGDLIGRLLLGGDGVALLPRFLVRDEIADGRLVTILPDWTAPQLWLSLLYPPYERLPQLVAAFSDFFEHHVTEIRPLREVLGEP